MGTRRGRRQAEALLRPRVGRDRVGLLLAALHNPGLATLTHAPSPMGFLKEILGRPTNERPFLLLPSATRPTMPDAEAPLLEKKELAEIDEFIEPPTSSW